MQDRKHFFILNVGHFLDHLFLPIFATAAALALPIEGQFSDALLDASYDEL